MAIAQQQNVVTALMTNSTTVNASFGACTVGSKLIATIGMDHRTATMSVSGSSRGAYTEDIFVSGGAGQNQAGGGGCGIYRFDNTTTSSETVTATSSIASYGYLKLYEYTGVDALVDTGSDVSLTGAALSVSVDATDNNLVIEVNSHYTTGSGTDATYTSAYNDLSQDWSYHSSEYILDAGAAGTKTLTHNSYTSTSAHTSVVACYSPSAAPDPQIGFIQNVLRPKPFKPGLAR